MTTVNVGSPPARSVDHGGIGRPAGPRTGAARRTRPVAALGLLALLATACGGHSIAGRSTASSPVPSATPSLAGPPGTSGTTAAVTSTHLEVQNPAVGQVTVNYSSATRITRTVAINRRALTAGSCVAVTPASAGPASTGPNSASPAPAGGPVTARLVTISAATAGGCLSGAFRGGRGAESGPSSVARSPRPSSGRRFGGVFGKVTAVSGSGFAVQGRQAGGASGTGANDATATVTVITTPTTSYTTTVAAKGNALKVGQCVTAVGPADSTGAISARSISIRLPGPNGCISSRGYGRGASGAGGND